MSKSKLLSSVVDEALTVSPLPPVLVSLIRKAFVEKYGNGTLMSSLDYPEIADKLYSFEDDQKYSLVALSFVDDDYRLFLMNAENLKANSIKQMIVQYAKDNNLVERENLSVLVQKVRETFYGVFEAVNSCVRSTRKSFSNPSEPEDFVTPSWDFLQDFYECGRKRKYSADETSSENLQGDNSYYLCSRCGLFHQGRTPTPDETVPVEIMRGRWLTTYRRTLNI